MLAHFSKSIRFRGAALARLLKDREHEIERDNRDRRLEKEEIEDLRQKLVQENVSDVEGEIKRRLEKEEEQIRRRLVDLVRSSGEESAGESDQDDENRSTSRKENLLPSNEETKGKAVDLVDQAIKVESPKLEPKSSPQQSSALGGPPIGGTKIPSKRKLAMNEAFRDDQDEETNNSFQKKSKLSGIPEPLSQGSPQVKEERTTPVKTGTATTPAPSAQAQEEKRQAVRKLIESIPTKKDELFKFPLDWNFLDSVSSFRSRFSFLQFLFFVFRI